MLSGALLNTAMVGIVRFIQVSDAAQLGMMPRTVVVSIGALSLCIAALFITRQTGIKRLMAYSSVEHMGVMALGFGFGGPLGVAGALYHMLGHSLNKSLMFFGAGNAMHVYRTKRIGRIHRVLAKMPVSGLLWLAGAVAITGAPPFGLFPGEFTILRAGLAGPNYWAALVMLALLVVIFVGFLNHFRAMYFGVSVGSSEAPNPEPRPDRQPEEPREARHRLSVWCLLPMWLALIPLLVLGLWWPPSFTHYFAAIASQLSVAGTP
jgi:hydrogenase-4 component F